jgi:hypothetical protein
LTDIVKTTSRGQLRQRTENQDRNAVLRSSLGSCRHSSEVGHRTMKFWTIVKGERNTVKYEEMGTIKGVTAYFGSGGTVISSLPDHPIKEVAMRQLLIVAAVSLIPTTGYAQAADYFRLQNDLKRSEMDAQQRMYEQEQRQREQLSRDQQRQREREIEQMRRRDEETIRSPRNFDYLGR